MQLQGSQIVERMRKILYSTRDSDAFRFARWVMDAVWLGINYENIMFYLENKLDDLNEKNRKDLYKSIMVVYRALIV